MKRTRRGAASTEAIWTVLLVAVALITLVTAFGRSGARRFADASRRLDGAGDAGTAPAALEVAGVGNDAAPTAAATPAGGTGGGKAGPAPGAGPGMDAVPAGAGASPLRERRLDPTMFLSMMAVPVGMPAGGGRGGGGGGGGGSTPARPRLPEDPDARRAVELGREAEQVARGIAREPRGGASRRYAERRIAEIQAELDRLKTRAAARSPRSEEVDFEIQQQRDGADAELVRIRTSLPTAPWAQTPIRDAIEEAERRGIPTHALRWLIDQGTITVATAGSWNIAMPGGASAAYIPSSSTLYSNRVLVLESVLVNGQVPTGNYAEVVHELFHAVIDHSRNRELRRAFGVQMGQTEKDEPAFKKGENAASIADEIGAYYVEQQLIPKIEEILARATDTEDAVARWAEAFAPENLTIQLEGVYTDTPGRRRIVPELAHELAKVLGYPAPVAPGQGLGADHQIYQAMASLLQGRPARSRVTRAEERGYQQRLKDALARANADSANAERILREVIDGPGRDLGGGRRMPLGLMKELQREVIQEANPTAATALISTITSDVERKEAAQRK